MASLGTDIRLKLPEVCQQNGAPGVNSPQVRPSGVKPSLAVAQSMSVLLGLQTPHCLACPSLQTP